MRYNYYSHKNFSELRKTADYQYLGDYLYLGAYKHSGILDNKILLFLFKKILPSLYIEKDMAQSDLQKIQKIINKTNSFYFSGFSSKKLSTIFAGVTAQPRGTFIIDLTQPLEKIWDNFDYSLQKQIKKAENLGLMIKKIDDFDDFKKYYDLLKSFRSVLKFKTASFKSVKKLWQTLHQNDLQNSCYEVFLCRDKENRILAGMGIMINPDEKIFIEVAAARSQYAITNKLPDNNFLKWQIIKWGQQNGFRHYNLAGVELNPTPGSKEEGIYRFKKKWGGQFVYWYSYEKYFPQNRWYYPIFYWLFKKLGIISQ